MARKEKILYTYTDDLSGEELEESEVTRFVFTHKGEERELYLGADNARDFKAFLDASSKTVKTTDTPPKVLKQNAGWTSKDVRDFWKDNGGKNGLPDFKPNGRIFDAVYEAFNKKHPAK